MKVQIHLKETSQVLEHSALNAYTKGELYCVYCENSTVYKYPLSNIWRITEDYK